MHINPKMIAAMLVAVTVIGLSAFAVHAPAQNHSRLTLKDIRTDKTAALYADNHTNRGSWFVEMTLPTDYADNHTNRGSWFVEMVLPTGDSENLKSIAATL